jgi:hypothetical protein
MAKYILSKIVLLVFNCTQYMYNVDDFEFTFCVHDCSSTNPETPITGFYSPNRLFQGESSSQKLWPVTNNVLTDASRTAAVMRAAERERTWRSVELRSSGRGRGGSSASIRWAYYPPFWRVCKQDANIADTLKIVNRVIADYSTRIISLRVSFYCELRRR